MWHNTWFASFSTMFWCCCCNFNSSIIYCNFLFLRPQIQQHMSSLPMMLLLSFLMMLFLLLQLINNVWDREHKRSFYLYCFCQDTSGRNCLSIDYFQSVVTWILFYETVAKNVTKRISFEIMIIILKNLFFLL